MSRIFRNRKEAGALLAAKLVRYRGQKDVLVLGLPRGGVPVAFEVARALPAALDVFVVRKLGVPGQEELAMGAIATGGVRVLNRDVVIGFDIPADVIDQVAAREEKELKRREIAYRGHAGAPQVSGKTIILIDDGIATGSTMRAAIKALRMQHPRRLIVAAPVAAASTASEISREADETVFLETPAQFYAVGQWYVDFGQTSDAEVAHLLKEASLALTDRQAA